MRPPFDVRPPQRRPWPWIAVGASVLVHSLFLFTSVSGRRPTFPRLPQQLIVLSPPSEGREDVPMRYQPPEAQANRRGRAPAEGEQARGTRLSRPVLPTPPRKAVAALPEKPPERPAADTGSAPRTQPAPRQPQADALGRIAPGLAQGRLWVRPLPLPPKELAQRLTECYPALRVLLMSGYTDAADEAQGAYLGGLPFLQKPFTAGQLAERVRLVLDTSRA